MKTILSYLFLVLFTVVFSYLFIDPNFIHLKSLYTGIFQSQRLTVSLTYGSLICFFFLFYIFFLRRIKKDKNNSIFYKIIIISSLLAFSYPAMLSFDIFNYIFTSRILFQYGENPYIVMPIEFINDQMLLFTHAPNKTALYGPSWILLTGIPLLVGSGNFLLTLLSFKLFILIFYFLTTFLIYKLTKSLYNTAFFALNPLILIETLISGHNDMAMIFFILLSFYLIKRGKSVWGLISFLLSVMVKFSTFFLTPVFIMVYVQKILKKSIDWEKIYLYSAILMFFIFTLSFIREEIYPWYAAWFMAFIALLPIRKNTLLLTSIFTFCLMLRYIPFMLLGTHFGPTPMIKTTVSFLPVTIVGLLLFLKRYVKR